MAINTTQVSRHAEREPIILNPESVSSPGREYVLMAQDWELGSDLWLGTKQMRKRSTKWLPQEEAESDQAYQARLNKTFLFNAYRSTIERLAGQVFFKPVVVENVPSELEYLERDFDSEGRSITEVAHEELINMLRFGKAHGIVDYPNSTSDLSVQDERRLNIRPYFTSIDPRDLIAWRNRRIGGNDFLDQVRIQEFSVEPYKDFGEIDVFRVRVFYPDRVEVWTVFQGDRDDYQLEEELPFTLGEIPLVTAYANKTGFLTAEPPLNDLAWLNLRHWQSTSEQNTILHASRVPIFFARGFEEGEINNQTIGAYRGIATTNENADINYIEHSGEAIGAGERDLEKLEKQMHEIGADLLVSRSVDRQTATARGIDRAESLSKLQTMVISLQRMLENSYKLAGQWLGIDASEVQVKIGNEFDLPVEANSTEDLINLFDKGQISKEKLHFELRRRGTLSEIGPEEQTFVEDQQGSENEDLGNDVEQTVTNEV